MRASFARVAAVLAAAGIAACGGALAQPRAEIVPPDVLVKDVTLEVIDLLQKDKDIQGGGAAGRKKVIELIETRVLPHFNFEAMTASAVGRNWAKASPQQKARLNEEFKTLLVRTYSSALASYSSQRFDFRPLRAKPTDTDVTVHVRVIQSGAQPVTIDYDMEKRPGGWKVWDVRVAGVSLVANYRTEFDLQVRDKGIDGLIKALQTKNRALEQPAATASSEGAKK